MRHYRSLEHLSLQSAWLTIGSFDGVHRGHQEIVRTMTAGAHRVAAPAVVLTFFPHPARVLRAQSGPFYLSTPEERAGWLGEAGADFVITLPFDAAVAATPAGDFVAGLRRSIVFDQLWVGREFALGRGRQGDVAALTRMGDEMGFAVQVVPPVESDGQKISSSQARALLQSGEVAQAAHLLGRPYSLSGEVVHGDARGRTIGIPTANLAVWEEQIVPAVGVYACRAWVAGLPYLAAVNIGIRPTFDGGNRAAHVEAHLLDFDGDLYQHPLTLQFIARLRGEQRFPSVNALVAQIHADIAQTRVIVSK